MTEEGPYLADQAGRRFAITTPATLIGRSPNCQVYIADRRASRRHAVIDWDGEVCVLRHLSNTNPTLLNGCRISAPQVLRDGDEIAIAGAEFTFHDPDATLRAAELPLLVVDAESGDIWVNRRLVSLSAKERALFDLLYGCAGRIHSKQEIAEAVWPEYHGEVYDYQIESLVKRLRAKIEPDPHNPVLIVTVTGRGYRLCLEH